MSWIFELREGGRILRLTTEGVHTPADVQQMAREAVARAKPLGIRLYLVDDRKMVPDFGTLDIYKLPRELQGMGVSSESRIAVVISGASPKKADFKFHELVAGNFGGVQVRIFEDDLEPALAWLEAAP